MNNLYAQYIHMQQQRVKLNERENQFPVGVPQLSILSKIKSKLQCSTENKLTNPYTC